jgi:uncharacterized membrane protein
MAAGDSSGLDAAEPAEPIAEIEAEIERLLDAAERCRKIMRIARVVIALGMAALLLMLVGVLRFDAVAFVVAVTAVLAGIPLFGSIRSTLHEILAQVRAQEARRAQMIDGLGLQTV